MSDIYEPSQARQDSGCLRIIEQAAWDWISRTMPPQQNTYHSHLSESRVQVHEGVLSGRLSQSDLPVVLRQVFLDEALLPVRMH